MQVCLFCGAANSPGAAVCHSCAQPLAVEEEQGSDNPEVEGAEEPSTCPMCAQPVDPTDKVCRNCNRVLISDDPLDRPAPRSHDRDITTRYDEFAQKVQAVLDGNMTRDQFGTWLGTMQKKLLSQRERYVEMIQTSGYYEFSSDEVDMGMTGILEYEQSMEMMVLWAGNPDADDSILADALGQMWEGNQKCNEAMRINREFRAQLDEDWGYM